MVRRGTAKGRYGATRKSGRLFILGLWAIWLVLTSISTVSAAREWIIEKPDGQAVRGTIAGISGDGKDIAFADSQGISVRLTGGIKAIKLVCTDDELNNQRQRAIWTLFADGSAVGADDIVLNDGTATLTIDGQMILIPEAFLVSVRFIALDEQKEKEWTEIFSTDSTDDMLIVNRSDSLTYYRGHIRGITAEKVLFDLDGDALPVAREKVAGVRLVRSAEKLDRSCIAQAVMDDKSVWSISSVEWDNEGQKILIVPQLELDWSGYLDSNRVIALEFPVERPDYLSDLRPESIEWTPFMSVPGLPREQLLLFNQPRFNQGFGSESMSIAGCSFDKGICLKSRTEIVFRLPEAYSRLRATVGIDDLARPRGNVELVVFGDERELVRKTVVGSDPAFDLDVSISGVKRVRIFVDFGDQAAVGDVLTLGSPVLLK